MGVAVDQHIAQHRRKARRDAPPDPLGRPGQSQLPLSGCALLLTAFKELEQTPAGLQTIAQGDFPFSFLGLSPHNPAEKKQRLLFCGGHVPRAHTISPSSRKAAPASPRSLSAAASRARLWSL